MSSAILTYARIRLREWGRWSKHSNSGFPTMSAFVRQCFGRSTVDPDPPNAVMEIEGIVRRAETRDKEVLILVYCQTGSMRAIAERLGIPKSTLHRRLEWAEWYVHLELDGVGQNLLHNSLNGQLSVRP